MASKKSDDKAIVSFSSDSDEDDSSSSSSRLSSSASSGEDSEVETVTFSVPFPSSGQASTQGAAVGAKEESKSKTRSETKKAEPVKAVSPEPRKSPVAEAKEKSPLRRTNVTEEVSTKKEPILTKDKLATSDSIKELRKSPGKQEEAADKLKVTKRAENSVSSERAKSPKIIVNDVDEEPPKQTKKSSENDVTLTSSKTVRKSPENDVTVTSSKATNKIRGASPKKTSDDVEAELPLLSSKSMKDGARAVSPRKEEAAEDLGEVTKTTKRSSKLTAERTKSPKDAEEEPASVSEVKSIDRAKSPKKTAVDKDVERAKSPKQILEENDSERAKSPKKTLDAKDAERAKSPKKTLEEQVAERAISPKKTAEDEENVERAKSPKTSAKDGGEAKKKSNKDSSKTPYELLRSAESPEKEKSPTRSTKSKKSLTTEDDSTTPKRKSPLKDLEGKELETGDTPDAVDQVKPKKASKKTARSIVSDDADLSKAEVSKKDEIGVSEAKVTDSSDTANEVEQLLKEIRQKRISQMANEPGLESETPDGGNKSIRVTVDEAGKTDDAALKTPNSEQNDAEVKEKDYMKVTSSSTNPANEAPGSKPDLENEESEFTYRRKSMDDFIKRILAEAKEERLKQKHGGGSANETTEDEKKGGVDRYAERNGDITENGLDRTKWSNGESSEDREGSMLDRRLAKIEKRRFGGSADAEKGEGGGEKEGGRSKVGKETEEEGTTNRATKSAKDPKDFDVNLDEDLEEINRFLQSRKTAASRFDFDEPGQNDDATTATTPTKRRWATGKEQQPEDEDLPSPGSRSQIKKKYSADVDFNEDDERYLGRFKRDRDSTLERDSALPEESFSPRRRNETDEVVRERTRNVRVLVDQQVEIVQAMRTTSKSLDELEKEIREVRQVCLNRQARIEALEGALGAEYRAFENDQLAATDRQKSSEGLNSKEDFGLAGFGRLRRQDKFKSESLDEENFPFRRRSGSVSSTTSYTSGFDGRGRLGDGGNDAVDSRPPSGLKQQSRDPRRTSETESDFSSGLDRRRGGSAARDRTNDLSSSSFGPDDMTFLSQRPARSRASIATSNPAVDYAGTISGDSFLAKIRAKYSFLAPSIDNQSYSSSIRSNSGISSSYASPSSLTYGSKRLGSRDILTSSSPYSSLGTGVGGYGGYSTTGGGRYSITDTRSYGTVGFLNSSGISGISSSYGDSGRMRRAQSVSEVSFDRSITSPTNLGSSGGGEFHSRFLDKVRGKKAMAEDASSTTTSSATTTTATTTKGQEKPFKSRFLKTTSFDAGSSRSDRLTNGFEDGDDVGEHRRGVSSEINGNA